MSEKRAPKDTVFERVIFSSRWMLYPINIGLLLALAFYIVAFFINEYHFFKSIFMAEHALTMEHTMLEILHIVDIAMVANLIIVIVVGSHQIFISKFNQDKVDTPQFLDHIDTGILKVKVALSICGITLVQMLKDFFYLEKLEWSIVLQRGAIHVLALVSALTMAVIWRITHPNNKHD